MIVIYYTTTHFLDAALGTIHSIKNQVELHVVIELSPDSKTSTIIDIEDLNGLSNIEKCEHVVGKENWERLKGYFEGVASVLFVVHKHKKSFSANSLKVAAILGRHIKKLKADIVHFDSITARSVGLYPYISNKKVFITIHDPKPHSGEYSWKGKVPKFVFFRLAKGFFFYSNFAYNQFRDYRPSIRAPKYVIRLQPYTYISQFLKRQRADEKSILFFGRLSLYKGVDLLLEAIPKVLEKKPNEKFIIAGGPSYGYEMDQEIVSRYKNNICLIANYLSTADLVNYLESSKFVVCPYRDATQSGVLMTCFAAGKMVVATNVGAFPEYIKDGENGLLTEPDADAIAHKILEALEDEKYKQIEENLTTSYSDEISYQNQKCIIDAYQNA